MKISYINKVKVKNLSTFYPFFEEEMNNTKESALSRMENILEIFTVSREGLQAGLRWSDSFTPSHKQPTRCKPLSAMY